MVAEISSSWTLSESKSFLASAIMASETLKEPLVFKSANHWATVAPACKSSPVWFLAKYHNNLSKLEEIKISMAGDKVALTSAPLAYSPDLRNLSKISFSLVAMINLSTGKPISLA
ncbi:hypothetical protein WICPIJ_005847 [Wickerhamomyces pijperi]|uniref:Uncharacterized protein n=1 Tax=Wickerhamomyces pijperi TaxID=599730 RepID=A0A9P8TKQ8_WICPI|nr:hypothetical protein WICPIJ_005847 [Wickerhamomyces pijperi]